MREVEGQHHAEETARSAAAIERKHLDEEEAALDPDVIPVSRINQVRNYFRAVRRGLAAQDAASGDGNE